MADNLCVNCCEITALQKRCVFNNTVNQSEFLSRIHGCNFEDVIRWLEKEVLFTCKDCYRLTGNLMRARQKAAELENALKSRKGEKKNLFQLYLAEMESTPPTHSQQPTSAANSPVRKRLRFEELSSNARPKRKRGLSTNSKLVKVNYYIV